MMVTLTLVLTFGRISDLHALDRVRVLDDNRGVLGRTRIQGHSLEFSLPLRARTHQGGESLRHRVRLKDGQEMMHANCRGRDGSRGRGGRSPTGGLHRSHSTVPLLSDMTRFRTAGEILVPHTFRVQVDLIVRITRMAQQFVNRLVLFTEDGTASNFENINARVDTSLRSSKDSDNEDCEPCFLPKKHILTVHGPRAHGEWLVQTGDWDTF